MRAALFAAIVFSGAVALSDCSATTQRVVPVTSVNADAVHPNYPRVTVNNRTTHLVAHGIVRYVGCNPDTFGYIHPGATWRAQTFRGWCLVREVSVYVQSHGRQVRATYQSSGTSYSKFAVRSNANGFEVVRV